MSSLCSDPNTALSYIYSRRSVQELWLEGANRRCFPLAKAFDTAWVDGLLDKLTALNFPSTFSKPCLPTSTVGRFKRLTKQPQPLVAACGLA